MRPATQSHSVFAAFVPPLLSCIGLVAAGGSVGCVGGLGAGSGEPEPEATFQVGSENPHREDFESAWASLDPQLQARAEPVEAGTLTGTFALRAVSATLVDTVLEGEHRGGGVNYRLVTRTYDEELLTYAQESVLCDGFNFEVAGVTSGVGDGVYRLVPPSVVEVIRADPDTGTYLADDHVQLWGIKDLPDPLTTPFPADRDEAGDSPHAERIYDMDDDGHDGITLWVHAESTSVGTADGEVYAIQRKRMVLTGVSIGPDQSIGYTDTAYESLALGSEPDLIELIYQGSAEPHPDRDESFYEELRIADGADCDDVIDLVDSGAFEEDVAPWL